MLRKVIYKIYEIKLLRDVKSRPLPNHIAIIMDGNRRFARRRGLPPYLGHMFGSDKAEEVLEWCLELGIRNLTIYAFSTENFKRSRVEKENLFRLMESRLKKLARDKRIHENRVRVRVIGKRELLPKYVVDAIKTVERATRNYRDYRLNIAIAYGGRQEITDAIREILRKVRNDEIDVDEIDHRTIEEHLYSNDCDYFNVDLLIRTGGEQRLSNFLPWQSANSVAYFCDVYWPEFRKIDLLRAIRTWQIRKFGQKRATYNILTGPPLKWED